jgi:predicted RNA-binding protein with RPS1 domain
MQLITHRENKSQKIMVLDGENFVFYRNLALPQLTGNIYYGIITGINKKLGAVFVRIAEDRVGLLNFHSIHPEYLAPDSKEILTNLAKENPQSLKNSEYYRSIDFARYLHLGQRIRVQVINVCRDFKIKLSCFLVLKRNGIRYIPNSIKQAISCFPRNFQKQLIKEKFSGSVYINKNRPINARTISGLEVLRGQWREIKQKGEDCGTLQPILALEEHPISSFLEHFRITEICTTDNGKIDELLNRFEYTVKKVDPEIFHKYKEKITLVTEPRVSLPSGALCEVSRSSVGFQLTIRNPLGVADYDPTEDIIEQIYLRNLGGLGIIVIEKKIELNLNYTLEKISKKFANYNPYLYPIVAKDYYLIVFSKKYHLPCAASYKNHCKASGEQEIILADNSKINLSSGENILKVDLNRHKSRKSNLNINREALQYFMKKKFKEKLLFIDLLESTEEELKLLASYLQKHAQGRLRLYCLSISVMLVEILE